MIQIDQGYFQEKALDELYVGLHAINDEPADEAFDAIMSRRFHIGRKRIGWRDSKC